MKPWQDFPTDGALAAHTVLTDIDDTLTTQGRLLPAAYEAMANLATKAGVEGAQKLRIHSPLISLSKAQIILEGMRLGVNYADTSSCYDPGPDGKPCQACDSCILRAKGFAEAGVADPLYLVHGIV
jgi:7-cyano-7-deazaguanine synthase in queuosine biosynthesis